MIQQPATWIMCERISVPGDVPLFYGFKNYSLLDSLPGVGETHRALEMPNTQIRHLSPAGSGVEEVPSATYLQTSWITQLKLATWWA